MPRKNKPKKGLLLLSGGIDSPVAGHLMKQRGVEISAVHFSIEPISEGKPEEKSRKITRKLGLRNLYLVNVSEPFLKISEGAERKLYFVLTKRFMLRVAEKIAERKRLDFLITGENLGQVSSQTLENLSVIDRAVEIPVLRPLLGFDKQEIVDLAKEISTYSTSAGKEVCDILGPDHPYTKARLEEVLKEEKKLNLGQMIEEAVERAEELKI